MIDRIADIGEWCVLIGFLLFALFLFSIIILFICKGFRMAYYKLFPNKKLNSASEINSQYGIIGHFIDVINQELKASICKGDKIDYIKNRIQLEGQVLKLKASIDGYYSIEHKSDTDKKKKLDEILLEIIDYRMQMVGLSIICNNANHIDKQKTILLFTDLKNELNNISEELDVLQIHRAIQNYLSKHSYADMEIGKELNEQIKKIEAEVEKIKQAKYNGQAQQ